MVFLISVLHGYVSNFDDKRNVLYDEMYIDVFQEKHCLIKCFIKCVKLCRF